MSVYITAALFVIVGMCGLPALALCHSAGYPVRVAPIWIGVLIALLRAMTDQKSRKLALRLLNTPITYLMIAYMVIGWLSRFATIDRYLFNLTFDRRLTYFFLPWLTGALIASKPKDWIFAVAGYLFFSLYTTGYCVWSGLQVNFRAPIGDWHALHRNLLADIVVAAYDMALALALSLRPWRFKFPLAAYCGFNALALFATLSRGGAISFLTSTVCLFSMRSLKWYYGTLLTAGLILLLSVGVAFLPDEVKAERSSTQAGTSADARPRLWELSQRVINENPGKIWGWGIKPRTEKGELVDNFCNWLLQDYMEAGALEALVSTGILIYAIWIAWRNHHRLPARSPAHVLNTIAIVVIGTRYVHGSFEAYWDAIYEHAIVYYLLGYLTYTQLVAMKDKEPRELPSAAGRKAPS